MSENTNSLVCETYTRENLFDGVSCETYTNRGVKGDSAYKQAVDGGYTGTLEEFEAALATDISTIATNITDINTTAENISDIHAVAGNETNINAVASNETNINAVNANTTNINAVAGNEANINAVNANKTNIDAVAGNSTNINTVATNISNVNTAVTNMSAIIAAPTAATNAANSAAEAQIWAEGTDGQVSPLGGEHSSKGWANVAKQYAESIGAALKYKGSVANYASLPSSGQEIGDVWNVLDTGENYAWTGTEWDKLSGTVDLSAYRTAAAQDLIDATKQDTITDLSDIRSGASAGASAVQPEDLAAVATTGAYADLSGVPSIPTVNNSTITLTQGGVTKGSFTLNQNTAGTIDLDAGGSGGGGKNIGEVYFSESSSAQDNPGGLPLFTGETIANADQVYPDFYTWVANHASLQISAADYETAITTYGECPKYVIDTTNKTIRLPKLTNYVKMANTTDGIAQSTAGLPNITGKASTGSTQLTTRYSSGALSAEMVTATRVGGSTSTDSGAAAIGLDASASNSIYGNSNTVTPSHTTLYPWVCAYNAAVPASTAQAAEFQTALTGKLDVGFGNLSNAGKALIGSLALPSDTTIQLSKASDYKYTAAADGYVTAYTNAGLQMFVFLENDISKRTIEVYQQSVNSGSACRGFMPVRQGQNFYVSFGGISGGSVSTILFTYAIGSEPQN